MTTCSIFMGPMWTKRISLMPEWMLRSEMLLVGARPRVSGLLKSLLNLKTLFSGHITQ